MTLTRPAATTPPATAEREGREMDFFELKLSIFTLLTFPIKKTS